MKTSINVLIVVLLTILSFTAAQAFECAPNDLIPLTGKVCAIQYSTGETPSKIWIAPDGNCDPISETYEIIGFPFGNLELQLTAKLEYPVEINPGDCVKIEYIEKSSKGNPDYSVNKWCTLVVFCDDCDTHVCDSCPESASNCFEADEPNLEGMPLRHGPPHKDFPGNPPWK